MKRAERHFLIVFMSWVLLASVAQAAERAFYQGKNVNFVINFAAGGPTDIEGRIVARHLAKHIPGNPTILCKTCRERVGSPVLISWARWRNGTALPWDILPAPVTIK